MTTFWSHIWHIAVDASGRPFLCDSCPCPRNECGGNTCNPPMPDTLYITFNGLGGSFAVYNGKHEIAWRQMCLWSDIDTDIYPRIYPRIIVLWNAYLQRWGASITIIHEGCSISWTTGPSTQCLPSGAYGDVAICHYEYCVDTNSCTVSSLATCVVSLT